MKISLFQADLSLKFYHAEWGIAKIFITFFIDIRHHEFGTKCHFGILWDADERGRFAHGKISQPRFAFARQWDPHGDRITRANLRSPLDW